MGETASNVVEFKQALQDVELPNGYVFNARVGRIMQPARSRRLILFHGWTRTVDEFGWRVEVDVAAASEPVLRLDTSIKGLFEHSNWVHHIYVFPLEDHIGNSVSVDRGGALLQLDRRLTRATPTQGAQLLMTKVRAVLAASDAELDEYVRLYEQREEEYRQQRLAGGEAAREEARRRLLELMRQPRQVPYVYQPDGWQA